MKSFPRDVLLMRIELLEHQYEEQLALSDRRSLLERFTAAASRIRARAADGDAEFVDDHLRRVMGVVGLDPDHSEARALAGAKSRMANQPADDLPNPTTV